MRYRTDDKPILLDGKLNFGTKSELIEHNFWDANTLRIPNCDDLCLDANFHMCSIAK